MFYVKKIAISLQSRSLMYKKTHFLYISGSMISKIPVPGAKEIKHGNLSLFKKLAGPYLLYP